MKRIALAALALLAGGALLAACHHPHRPDPAQVEKRVTAHVEEVLDDLKATPEQRARVLAVKDRLLAEGKKLQGAHDQVFTELLAQWEGASFDIARVEALADGRIDDLRAFAHQAVKGAAEVHDVLTPEQRAQLARKIRRHHGG